VVDRLGLGELWRLPPSPGGILLWVHVLAGCALVVAGLRYRRG
jgi:hypothetical protein